MYPILRGFCLGYEQANLKNYEDKVKQGKSYYLVTILQFYQATTICSVATEIFEIAFQKTLNPLITLVTYPLLAAGILFLAVVKEGDYKTFTDLSVNLPQKLGERTVRIVNFLEKEFGNISLLSLTVEAVALSFLGNYYLGVTTIITILYTLTPYSKISPTIDRYVSFWVYAMVPFTKRSLLERILSIVDIVDRASPLVLFFRSKLDQLYNLPTVRDIETPLIPGEDLSFEEINFVVDATDDEFYSRYKINPAHYSKQMVDERLLPRDENFGEFIALFDSIKWETAILVSKLKRDKKFINLLREKFPNCGIQRGDDISPKIKELAQKSRKSEGEFVKDWVRKQMVKLVAILERRRPVKGTEEDLKIAISKCSIILHYLKHIDPLNKVELEDAVLKVAIEMGDYCGRGIKRASKELMEPIIYRHLNLKSSDPVQNFELSIGHSLQSIRLKIIQEGYDEICKTFHAPKFSTESDLFDEYELLLALEFYPITEEEKSSIGLEALLWFREQKNIRKKMYESYRKRLDEAFEERGERHYYSYLQALVNGNKRLTEEEKKDILLTYTTSPHTKRFHRLLLMKIGVIIDANTPC